MQMLLQYKLFKINQEGHYDEEKIILPPRLEENKRKTLILDLDETLIHCFENS
jgi:predicted HAD superfamily phosphohydrolase YqeG